jgi:hypothetical protein
MKGMPKQIKDAVKEVLLENRGYFITAMEIYGGLSAISRRKLKSYTGRFKNPEKPFSSLHAVAEAAKMVAEATDGVHTKAGWKNCRLYCIKKKP